MVAKLFAVYLGGQAPGCNTELHDVVFANGETIEATYPQLLNQWFGSPKGLHLDSWMELDIVDGYRVSLGPREVASAKKLYFINFGGYIEGRFAEFHANIFIVAESTAEAKQRGKQELARVWSGAVHTDDLLELDECLEVKASGYGIVLTPTDEKTHTMPQNGYKIVPKELIQEYLARS